MVKRGLDAAGEGLWVSEDSPIKSRRRGSTFGQQCPHTRTLMQNSNYRWPRRRYLGSADFDAALSSFFQTHRLVNPTQTSPSPSHKHLTSKETDSTTNTTTYQHASIQETPAQTQPGRYGPKGTHHHLHRSPRLSNDGRLPCSRREAIQRLPSRLDKLCFSPCPRKSRPPQPQHCLRKPTPTIAEDETPPQYPPTPRHRLAAAHNRLPAKARGRNARLLLYQRRLGALRATTLLLRHRRREMP